VTGKAGTVGKRRIIANDTIMRDMHIGHKKIAIANYCLASPGNRPPVQCAVLPDDIAVSDEEPGRFIFVGLMLRRLTDGVELEYLIVFTYYGGPVWALC